MTSFSAVNEAAHTESHKACEHPNLVPTYIHILCTPFLVLVLLTITE